MRPDGKFFNLILDLLFPPRCPFCRKLLKSGEDGICRACDAELPRTEGGGKQEGRHFSFCASPLYYEKSVRESFLRFKFGDLPMYGGFYAKLMAECAAETVGDGYDLISWAPLSKKRLKTRGYDQAQLLARDTARLLGKTATATLRKREDIPAQSGIGDQEKRRANVSGAYEVIDPALVDGKRVLLVDDIITTGSTLSECALVLRGAGAKNVICLTLARTRDPGDLDP